MINWIVNALSNIGLFIIHHPFWSGLIAIIIISVAGYIIYKKINK